MKSGFVNILGRPNVGKSTLMNALVGEKLSIITHKPQTTRHRILGIVNGDDFQIVFSDTPGVVRDPAYKMHDAMNRFVRSTFEDADLMLFLTDFWDDYPDDDPIIQRLQKVEFPIFLVFNKIDLLKEEQIEEAMEAWKKRIDFKDTFTVSALNKVGTDRLLKAVCDALPEGPEYYPKDQLTTHPERFFISEIIREKIFLLYKQEIPYATQVEVESFEEDTDIIRIEATIYVERKTQKPIVIGKGGSKIKKLGIEARKDVEAFLNAKVYLGLYVKIRENWRDDDGILRSFGYSK